MCNFNTSIELIKLKMVFGPYICENQYVQIFLSRLNTLLVFVLSVFSDFYKIL